MAHLLVLLASLAAAFLLTEICGRAGVPRVLGQVLAGAGLSALFAAFLFKPDVSLLSTLADVGILMLFFFVGLEIRLDTLAKHSRVASSISILNTLLPFAGGFAFCKYALGLDDGAGLVVAATLSFSSQAIALDVLEEAGKLKTRVGSIVVAAGLVDDLLEIGLISILLAVLRASAPHFPLPGGILGEIAVFFLVLALVKLALIPLVFRQGGRVRSSSNLIMGGLVIALFAAMVAEEFEVGAVIGALFSGILVRRFLVTESRTPWEEHRLARSLHLLAFGFFVPLFFVFVGMNTQISALASSWPAVLGLTIIAFVGTIGGTALAVKLNGGSWTEGHLIGWGLNSKGDTELVIAALALKTGLLSSELFSAVIVMAVLTTAISPIVFRTLLEHYSEKPRGRRQRNVNLRHRLSAV